MLLSICVPIYNVEKYIERCALSILSQLTEEIEVIFIDDCSSDQSISILVRIVRQYPLYTIKIIHHDRNRGLAAARNTGVDNSKGNYVWHIDSDDYIEHGCLKKILKIIERETPDILEVDTISHYSNRNVICKPIQYKDGKDLCIKLLRGDVNAYIWKRIIRRKLYDEHGIMAIEGVNMGEDAYVMTQLAYYAKKVISVHDIMYHYEGCNITSYTKTFSEKKEAQKIESKKIINRFLKNKEIEFREAFIYGYSISVINNALTSALYGNKKYYNYYLSVFIGLDKKVIFDLPIYKKIPCYVRNYYVVRLYMIITYSILSFVRNMKYALVNLTVRVKKSFVKIKYCSDREITNYRKY